MELQKSLEAIGLTQNEINIYTYLLSQGESLGRNIYKDTLLDKSSAYKALALLQNRELVRATGDSRNQLFAVTGKEKVIELFDKQKKSIDNSKTLFEDAFAQLNSYSSTYYQNENVHIFNGDNAYEDYHKAILRGTDIEVLRTLVSSETELSMAGSQEVLDHTNEWFIPLRISRGIAVRVLYDINTIPDKYDVSDSTKIKECRRFMKPMSLPAGMSTFGNRIGFNSIKNGKYWAIVINDSQIVSLINSLFDAIWEQSEIVNKQ